MYRHRKEGGGCTPRGPEHLFCFQTEKNKEKAEEQRAAGRLHPGAPRAPRCTQEHPEHPAHLGRPLPEASPLRLRRAWGLDPPRQERRPSHHGQPVPEAGVRPGRPHLPAPSRVRAGHAALRAAQTGTGVAAGWAGPAGGCAAAAGRGPAGLGGRARGGLLQPPQPAVWRRERGLHSAELPGHGGRPPSGVPLARRRPLPAPHFPAGPPVPGAAAGLGGGAGQRRGAVPRQRGHPVPQELPAGCAQDPVAPVPRVRARVHAPLRAPAATGLRGPRQHLLQALLLLCVRVRPHRPQGAGAPEGDDRPDLPLTRAGGSRDPHGGPQQTPDLRPCAEDPFRSPVSGLGSAHGGQAAWPSWACSGSGT